ncbi:MAG: amidohydrolase [Croceitalea sp.]|nr:amidohydrolase [Croceitalea sp.]
MNETLNIALVQTHLHWENPVANKQMLQEKLDALTTQVDIIILPEMFTTGFTMNPDHVDKKEGNGTINWMQKQAKNKDAAIVGSIVYCANQAYYNRLFFVKPDGTFDHYDKRHTFTLAGEHKVYKAGNARTVINFKGFRILPLICYDLRFPVWSRNDINYDVLLYVANWPKPRISAWETLLKARAIENMAYCIGVNRVGLDGSGYEYTGHSAVYDVLGEPLVFSEKETILESQLSMSHILEQRKKLKFLNDRDGFTLEY